MRTLLRSSLLLLLAAGALRSDEGMWTFDNVPLQKMKAAYGFAPDAAWLKKAQLATLRFPGGTGAFVSRDGLVITNHHVGRGAIAQVSSAQRDFIKDGFTAATRDQEIKVPGLALEVLVRAEDVTAQVRAAGAAAGADAVKARKDALARLRSEAEKASGLTCEAVTLYQGGEHWLYHYRRFQDVRLVLAPEELVADFGHDADNYSFPRFCLDFALFRVYEDGKPYQPEAYLPFANAPLQLGDLTVITGHPGVTYRQWTVAQIKQDRDLVLPWQIRNGRRMENAMAAFATQGPEAKRLATEVLKGLANGRKRNEARLKGLQNTAAMEKAQEAERAFQAAVAKHPALKIRAGEAWQRINQALALRARRYVENAHLAALASPRNLLGTALDLVRIHGEVSKPLESRLPEYRNEAAARQRLTSPRPRSRDLETALLAAQLAGLVEDLGPQHPLVKTLLAGRAPLEVARATAGASRLHELETRKQLLEGGPKAVEASADPLLAFARALDPLQRKDNARMERDITNALSEQSTRLAEARFQIYGKAQYPDATFTLRLSYGAVATYDNGVGSRAQPFTTLAGLYDRHWGWGGNAAAAEGGQWMLPNRWLERRSAMDLGTPYNFIYSCDTVGGNSGSPVLNAQGEFVGINFDSVYEGQGGYYIYDPGTKRAVALDARGILESLRKVLDADHLAEELAAR